ncbi:MAG: TetR/AcrR family transcriptional regulator [Bacteroidetes bacterium]|nr:TetR/AcrR family transcriptional regulator [Bacteroidota bacterium]
MPRTEEFNRTNVLDKAILVFWKKGYNGTSMQDLVDATGLNRSSIYNSFGSKMALYHESLKKYQGDSGALFERVNEQHRNALERIGLLFIYVMEDIVGDSEKKGCMLINCFTEMGNQDGQLRDLLEGNQDRLIGIFDDLVQKGQMDGSIRNNEESQLLAHYLVNAFQGFRITGLSVQDPKTLKSIIQNILKTLT